MTFLAGCSFQPAYQRPDMSSIGTFFAGTVSDGERYPLEPSNTARSASGRSAESIGWREFFIDPKLQVLIELALKNNRDLRISILNVEAARAQYQVSRATLLPSVWADVSQTRGRGDASRAPQAPLSSSYYVGAGASWELDLFGRVRSLRDNALSSFLAQAETRKAAEMALIAQVAIQYLTMLSDEEQLAVIKAALESAKESHRITTLGFANGTATELDIQQSKGILEQTVARYEVYSRAHAQSENALMFLIGDRFPDDLPQPKALNDQALLADIPAGLPSELIQRRPDIVAAEHQLKAANASIGAARAAFFPSISLTGNAGFLSASASGLFQGSQRSWGFTPRLTVPIFNGGSNSSNLDLAETMKLVEIANYERAIQAAFREVSDALTARSAYDYQISALRNYSKTQVRRLELAEMRYSNGLDGYLSVLQAQRDLIDAEQSLVSANFERASNLVRLYKALGGGWLQNSGDVPRDPSENYSAGLIIAD